MLFYYSGADHIPSCLVILTFHYLITKYHASIRGKMPIWAISNLIILILI